MDSVLQMALNIGRSLLSVAQQLCMRLTYFLGQDASFKGRRPPKIKFNNVVSKDTPEGTSSQGTSSHGRLCAAISQSTMPYE